MTQTHSLYLKWIDGAGTDNLVSWATSTGPVSDSHPDINGGAATDVQRIAINVPATITLPTLTPPNVSYTVTNNAAGAYTFSGAAKGDNPNLGPFYRGGTYTVNITATGHPFYFTTDNGTNFSAGTYFGEYTDGVTGSRTDSGTITFTVPQDAPDTLYYQCGNHGVMRGAITVKNLAVETNINGNPVVYFQHTQEGHKTPVELRPIPSLVNQMCIVYDASVNKFVPQDLATYVENTPSFENKIREVAGTAELVVEDGSAVVAKVNVYDDSTYLPLTGNNPGDQAFATDTDILYIWDGSAWQQAGAANTDDLAEGTTNLFYTDTRVGTYLSAQGYDTATNIIATITDSAPTTLDTLNELAAALGDDPNFATTVTNSIATKVASADFNSLWDARFASDSTTNLSEGTNLYYTDARADARIAAASIGDLSDVDITTAAPTDGQALVWNASNSEFEPGTVASSTNYFQTVAVSGQSDIVPDSTTDTLNFAAGANITLTTDASTDTLTIAATGGAANAFSTLAVAGQSNVVADSETDTLTFTAGTGMTITTDAGTDTITFESQGGGGGSLPVILSGSTSDPITLSDITVAGAIPFTSYDGTTDNIQLGSTQTAVTTFADNDADTSIELERTSDDDTVYIKAGGTDVVTATSSGVTITNLTVTGTTTQANELKVTDTLFELNADGASLTTDAGMIIERGSTGDNAAFIWDESADAFVVGTTATDGSSETNLTVTEASLKAATQSQGDNSTNVATTAYVDTATSGISSDTVTDADGDTLIEVENSDADEIVMTTAGQERLKVDNNVSMSARGGFFTHQLTMDSNETFTIASTEGTVAAGPLDVQGTVDVQGSLVVL